MEADFTVLTKGGADPGSHNSSLVSDSHQYWFIPSIPSVWKQKKPKVFVSMDASVKRSLQDMIRKLIFFYISSKLWYKLQPKCRLRRRGNKI